MKKKRQMTKAELIELICREAGWQSVGSAQLTKLRSELEKCLGTRTLESPAKLARALADLGVTLNHPEILEADTAWREARLNEFFSPGELEWETVDSASQSLETLEDLRLKFVADEDKESVDDLVQYTRELRDELTSRDDALAEEVSHWLLIWLQTPGLFHEWVSLRKNSAEFKQKFGRLG